MGISEYSEIEKDDTVQDFHCPNGDGYCTEEARCVECCQDALDDMRFSIYWDEREFAW